MEPDSAPARASVNDFFVRGGSAWGHMRSVRRQTGPQTQRVIAVKWVGPLRPGEQKRLCSEAQQVGGLWSPFVAACAVFMSQQNTSRWRGWWDGPAIRSHW